MKRENSTKRIGDTINSITNDVEIIRDKKVERPIVLGSKEILWQMFKKEYKTQNGKDFLVTENSKLNIGILFHYFLKDPKFFNHPNLCGEKSIPSFEKGLLIIGGYGTGKTSYLKALEKCFTNVKGFSFKIFTANSVVQSFEECEKPLDKRIFYENLNRSVLMFDDVMTEKVASNFGKIDIMKEVFEERYSNKLSTYVTCNFVEGHEGDVDVLLQEFGKRYGSRVYDRLFEMFNILVFTGKSMRK